MLFHIKMFTLTTLFNMKGFQRDPVTNEPVYDENHNLIPGVYTEAIFTSFFEGDKKKNIVIRMNPNAAAMFYHFNHGNFTQFFLKHHTKLKSKHSKTIYRQMLHGKNALKGSFVISKENLKLLIGTPRMDSKNFRKACQVIWKTSEGPVISFTSMPRNGSKGKWAKFYPWKFNTV